MRTHLSTIRVRLGATGIATGMPKRLTTARMPPMTTIVGTVVRPPVTTTTGTMTTRRAARVTALAAANATASAPTVAQAVAARNAARQKATTTAITPRSASTAAVHSGGSLVSSCADRLGPCARVLRMQSR